MALTPKTGQQIITEFEMQVDDTTELSSVEELILLNRIYRKILAHKAWLFLQKPHTATQSTSVDYIALPSDFDYLAPAGQYSDIGETATYPYVVFVGTDLRKYIVVNYADRRQYDNKDGYCYVDPINNRLVFTKQPTSAETVQFDYIYVPDDITLVTSPVIPAKFHDMFAYGMAVDDMIIQMFEKSRSTAQENNSFFQAKLDDMCIWNDMQIQI